MSSRYRKHCSALAAVLAAPALAWTATAGEALTALRVCADPDNLPFSHRDGSGFENRIAQLVAADLQVPLEYAWLPDRRGFVRKTMGADLCDVIVGVPVGFERTAVTRPYYRSAYVFVQPRDTAPPLATFDDPRIRSAKIGVQLIGNDLAASPPGYALARRGATDNVIGFTLHGRGPAAQRMIDAIAAGAIDAAVAWGPQAGYFARHAAIPMCLSVAPQPAGLPHLPFEFAIAMGVRKGDRAMQARLDDVLARRRQDIDAILAAYAVPRTDDPTAVAASCAK